MLQSIVPEVSLNRVLTQSAHEGESLEDPNDNISMDQGELHIASFIPFGERKFPNAFEGYPVDVVNGFSIKAGKQPTEAQEPSDVLCLGASIGVQGKEASGTLGAIVKDGSSYYALSCDHVMNSEKSRCIVHPRLNDDLSYLKYYLPQYKRCVDDVTGSETECSVETLSSSEALGNKFEELKHIKNNHPERSNYTSADLKRIEKLEKAFEEGNKPSRKIGEYFVGVNKNVWPQTNGKEYFIDAAIAKLPDEEVTRLKQSRTARLIESDIKIRGECEPEDIPAISETNKLCKNNGKPLNSSASVSAVHARWCTLPKTY